MRSNPIKQSPNSQAWLAMNTPQPALLDLPASHCTRAPPPITGRKSSGCAAISPGRLSLTDQGQVRYTLKTPCRDGTTHVVFELLDFIARLAALVPRPPSRGGTPRRAGVSVTESDAAARVGFTTPGVAGCAGGSPRCTNPGASERFVGSWVGTAVLCRSPARRGRSTPQVRDLKSRACAASP